MTCVHVGAFFLPSPPPSDAIVSLRASPAAASTAARVPALEVDPAPDLAPYLAPDPTPDPTPDLHLKPEGVARAPKRPGEGSASPGIPRAASNPVRR